MLKFKLWTDTEEKPKTKSIEQDCVKWATVSVSEMLLSAN